MMRRRLTRCVALVFLGLITVDLADSWCDAPRGVAVQQRIAPSTDAASFDPCANGCVPDCFCCSTAPEAWTYALSYQAETVRLATSVPPGVAVGVQSLPYHPPLA